MHDQNLATSLKNKSEDFDLLINHLTQGIICIDFEGVITACNLNAANILNLKKESLINSLYIKNFNDLTFGFSVEHSLKDKKSPEFKWNVPYLDLNLEVSCKIKSDGLILVFQDVTEQKKTESLAHASNRLKDLGSMTAMLAHEIRNPLGGIKGFASLLRKDLERSPELKQMVDLIIDGTDHLNQLVSHILNFAHPLQMKFKPVNIIAIVQKLKKIVEIDENLNQHLFNGKIKFEIKTSENQILLQCDEELLHSALLNLIINSIQAMPNGGFLTVFLKNEKDHVQIEVKDTGTGIAKENLKKIFSAFFTTKKQGNGFGLLEVYKVVEAHKGSIDVDSIVNEGTTFTIKIPK